MCWRALGMSWRKRTAFLGLLVICQILVWAISAGAVLVDKVVAVVNADVLTLLDFDDHLALLKVFQSSADDVSRERAFERFIDQTLLRQEALRTKTVQAGEAEVAEQLHTLDQRPDGAEALARVIHARGISLSHVRSWLRNQLIVSEFINRRIRLFVRFSDSEVTQYYRQHQPAIGEPLSDAVREQILRILVEQQVNARVTQLVEELRRKANLLFPP